MKFWYYLLCCFSMGVAQAQDHTNGAQPKVYDGFSSKKLGRPQASFSLPQALQETSGLLFFDGLLWTHNDDSDTTLYGLDTLGVLQKKITLPGVTHTDWEDIAQDSTHLYIGDFGNNASGQRTDLKIYKVSKSSLLAPQPAIDTIRFSYADQTTFERQPANTTDFDCEAFVVAKDRIYLFTKQWQSAQCRLYALPNQAGTQTATPLATYNSKGLITGASYFPAKNTLVLCGYSKTLRPFLLVFPQCTPPHFFSGPAQKITLQLPFHQIEALTTTDGIHYYLTNEAFVRKPFWHIPQQLHRVTLE